MIDAAVAGAGPAGLAASVALADRGVEHVVLERDRVATTWRAQRWDSFRLNTAGWMNPMLGEQRRDAYAGGREVVERLEQVAAGCPVREGVAVARLAPTGDGWALATDHGALLARAVVVATGDQHLPRVPALASWLPGRVAQLHAADYRGPGQLPAGAVLVVGSAQSGCQIAEDLLTGGRRVVLATSPVGRVPFRHRGAKPSGWWSRPASWPAAARPARPLDDVRRHGDRGPGPRPAPAGPGRRQAGRAAGRGGRRAGRLRPRVAANLAAGTPWPTGSGPWPTSASAAAACTRHPPNPTTMTPRSTGPAEVAGPAR